MRNLGIFMMMNELLYSYTQSVIMIHYYFSNLSSKIEYKDSQLLETYREHWESYLQQYVPTSHPNPTHHIIIMSWKGD